MQPRLGPSSRRLSTDPTFCTRDVAAGGHSAAHSTAAGEPFSPVRIDVQRSFLANTPRISRGCAALFAAWIPEPLGCRWLRLGAA